MSIRVTFVQPYLPAYRAPVYRALAAVPGIDFTLVHAKTKWIPNVPAEGFKAVYEPMKLGHVRGHPVYWQPSYWRAAAPDACDVLVAMWDVHYANNVVPALIRARRNGIGTVLWGQAYSREENWLRRRPRLWLGRLADTLVFYNETGRDIFLREGFDPNRLFVAYNSLDTSQIDQAIADWKTRPIELAEFRRAQGIDDRPLVLYVARLYPDRKAELLIDAAAILVRRGLRFRVALVGGSDEAYLKKLQARIDAAGLTDTVRLTGPMYGESNLAPWFLSARVFCFPTFMGLSLHHALAYGVPVLTTDETNANGPEIEALLPDVNGLTYRDGSVPDLADQLGRLLTDDALAHRLAANARSIIDEKFNLRRMVEGFVGAIEEADRRRKNRSACGV